MLQIQLQPRWAFSDASATAVDATVLLALLAAVQQSGSIAQAARDTDMSYRHAWGLIERAEALLSQPLLVRARGRGRGCQLTELGARLVWSDARIAARLQPLMASLASEMAGELGRLAPETLPPPRLHASHGFAVEALHEQLSQQGAVVDIRYRNSLEAVAALAAGDCELAGFHVPLGTFEKAAGERYRQWLRPDEHCLIQLAVRTQGLFVARGNPLGVHGLADLARPELRFVNRPLGSGTRMLTDLMLAHAGLRPEAVNGYRTTELTHAAVAAFVASGMADVGIGVQTAAHRFGLHFIPLTKERYFFAVQRRHLDGQRLQPVLRVLQSPGFRARVAELKGYDASRTGLVLDVDEVLPLVG